MMEAKELIVMEIVNVRVDERLVHAQVAAVWASVFNVNKIIVVDDGAAQDEIQKMALKMACPKSVKLSILTAESAALKLKEDDFDFQDRLFFVMKGVKTLKKIAEYGYIFKEVNVGNLMARDGELTLKQSVILNNEQIEIIKDLNKKGTKFTSQLVPSEEKIDLMKCIEEKAH